MKLHQIREKLILGIPISKINLRVTYYSRVSTEHIQQKNSIINQNLIFENLIKDNPNWTYIKGYIDEGITGTSDIKRKEFMKMIEDAKEDKFDLILTKEISRFSRNTLDSIKYTRMLLEYGVAVLFLNDNLNTALSDSELRLTIMASMAQDEIRRLSERVKFGMKASIDRGKILGHNNLYGYKKNKDNTKLIINEKESKNIKEIFKLYTIENYSLIKISKYLNNKNIKTPNNCNWNSTSIKRIIENPKYKGYYCGRKTEVIDYISKKVKKINKENQIIYPDKKKIPPIVSEEIWNKANERLNLRNIQYGPKYKDKTIYKNRYPLSAKMYCLEHNKLFHRRKNNNNISWYCSIYLQEGKNKCNSPNIKEKDIYKILFNLYKYTEYNKEKIIKLLFKNYNITNIKYIKEELNTLQIKEEIIKIIIDKIYVSKINNDKNNIKLYIYLNSKKSLEPLIKNYVFNQIKYKVLLYY